MNELNINTIIGVFPPEEPVIKPEEEVEYISRGASAMFEYVLKDDEGHPIYSYTINDIKQLSFMFRQDGRILKYDLFGEERFDQEGKLLPNPYFSFTYGLGEENDNVDSILLKLPAEETIKLRTTTPGHLVLCEVVIVLDIDNEQRNEYVDTTKIETFKKISVSDTIYGRYLDRQ